MVFQIEGQEFVAVELPFVGFGGVAVEKRFTGDGVMDVVRFAFDG